VILRRLRQTESLPGDDGATSPWRDDGIDHREEDRDGLEMLLTWAGHGGGPWFLLFPLLWIAVIVAVIFAFRGGWRRHWYDGVAHAESILGERFAKGEITAEEYRERREALHRKR
jgi:putative membrane protein